MNAILSAQILTERIRLLSSFNGDALDAVLGPHLSLSQVSQELVHALSKARTSAFRHSILSWVYSFA